MPKQSNVVPKVCKQLPFFASFAGARNAILAEARGSQNSHHECGSRAGGRPSSLVVDRSTRTTYDALRMVYTT